MTKDIAGKRFGILTATTPTKNRIRGKVVWELLCDCGSIVYRSIQSLSVIEKQNREASCGCYTNKEKTKHGCSRKGKKTKEYNTWCHLKSRCYTPKATGYKNYGGRGITVCERWMNSFENFFSDMGESPTPQHSIDRINNAVGYSPDNCRWATPTEQNNNKRPRQDGTYKNLFSVVGGITWASHKNRWIARIRTQGKNIWIGSFMTMDEAIEAKKEYEKMLINKKAGH